VTQSTGASTECTLTLTPGSAATSITIWTGSYAVCPAKYVPSSFR